MHGQTQIVKDTARINVHPLVRRGPENEVRLHRSDPVGGGHEAVRSAHYLRRRGRSVQRPGSDTARRLASDLAFGIGNLRSRVERGRKAIRTLNAELEARVRARTADLEAARDREATLGFRIQQMLLLTATAHDVPGLQVAALDAVSALRRRLL